MRWNLITFITNPATGISRFWLGRGRTHRAWAVMSPLRGHGARAEVIGQMLQSFTSIWRCNCGKWCSNWQKKQTWVRWTKRLTNGQIDVYSRNHLTKNGWISNYKRKKNQTAVNEINVKQLWKFVHIAFFHFFLIFPDFSWIFLILSGIDFDMALTYASFHAYGIKKLTNMQSPT